MGRYSIYIIKKIGGTHKQTPRKNQYLNLLLTTTKNYQNKYNFLRY